MSLGLFQTKLSPLLPINSGQSILCLAAAVGEWLNLPKYGHMTLLDRCHEPTYLFMYMQLFALNRVVDVCMSAKGSERFLMNQRQEKTISYFMQNKIMILALQTI